MRLKPFDSKQDRSRDLAVHLREGLDDPLLDSALDIGELEATLGGPIKVFDYVRITQVEGVVANGFAFESEMGSRRTGPLMDGE
jgi:hypothetical protein